MQNPEDLDSRHDDEFVPEDDAVIGRAFRRSMIGFAIGGVLVAAVFLWNSARSGEEAPEVEITTEAPVVVEHEEAIPTVLWKDVTKAAGIDFVHFNGAEGEKLLPETMGSGAVFFDADGDEDQDLLLANGTAWPHSDTAARTCRFYLNDGAGNFTDATVASGLDVSLYGTGAAVGDFDNDGATDIFLAAVGTNRLLRNRGDGTFLDVTDKAGLAGNADDWSTSAAFFDLDGDADLDLFVANYVRWSREIDQQIDYRLTGVGRAYGPPVNYQGTFSDLYRNNGDGTFTEISAEAGIEVRNEATDVPVGKALGIAPVDIDRDGAIDLLIANDTVRNFLFHNRGDGTFQDMAEFFGLAYGREGEATGAMGVDAAHYRNDAELGFAIGNFANEMTSLYISQGEPTLFADEAIVEGIGAPSRRMLSFGILLFDYDLDGRLDMLQANGHLENEINRVDPSQTYEQPVQLFWNAGPDARQSFIPVDTATSGDLGMPIVGRGNAYADIDADGDLDVILTQVGRAPLLLRNEQNLDRHWLRVRLEDPTGAREAIGAWIELDAGGVTQRRQVMPTRSYQSQSELPVTFGLGAATKIDGLRVTWPDGTVQEVPPPAIDQALVLRRE